MDLATRSSLIVASLDLQLVRLLRDAIRTADIAGGKFDDFPLGASSNQLNAVPLPRDRFEPTPYFEPRKTIHPTPRFEARPVYHEQIELPALESSDKSTLSHSPLPPPWKTPVWQMPIQPAQVVKVHMHRTDVHNKGSLIDLFL